MPSNRTISYQITADTQGARRALLSAECGSRLVAYRIARADGHSAVQALRMACRRVELESVRARRSPAEQEAITDAWYALDCPPPHDPNTDRLIQAYINLHSVEPRPLNRLMAEIDLAAEEIDVDVPEYTSC
jgi:hypothetical protein